jgi:3-oxoacyl-[acyl-carrier-protein] synthase III
LLQAEQWVTLQPQTTMEIPLHIESTGVFLPSRRVSAEELDKLIGRPTGWTLKHTGVEERRFVDRETASEMGAAALSQALSASVNSSPVDLVLSASGTPQQLIPNNSSLVAREMGWAGAPCWDINATCLGFVAAMDMAAQLLATKRFKRIAIVCSEIASRGLNFDQPEAAALMGDGAAAVIVSSGRAGGNSRLMTSYFVTWPEGAELTCIRGGGSTLPAREYVAGENDADFLFHMDGPGVFKLASTHLEEAVHRLVGEGQSRWDAVSLVIPHQGSLPAMRLLRKRLGIPESKLEQTASRTGNMISVSIPFTLHTAIENQRLRRGDQVLLLGTSAGLSIGGLLLKY